VRLFYSVRTPHDSTSFPWKRNWRSKAPLKVFFFFFGLAWLAALGKILPLDNLRKRHIIVVD
jgi:hypothetical protein